jgi:lysophospholipase L1-like esterase
MKVAHLWCAVTILLAVFGSASAIAASPRIIATYGTSLTAEGEWQQPLEAALERCGAGEVDVLNFGKDRSDSRWGAANTDQVIAANPDLVLIEFSYNDAYVNFNISLSESRMLTDKIVDDIKNGLPHARIFLMTMNWPLGRWVESRPQLNSYYDIYRQVAAERHLGLVDTAPQWKLAPPDSLRDEIHPTKAAHEAVTVPAIVSGIGWCAGGGTH